MQKLDPKFAERAKAVWQQYQLSHNVSDRIGQAVGIDPVSGRVWFGGCANDIWKQLEQEGFDNPLFYLRVGCDYYVRKGGRR